MPSPSPSDAPTARPSSPNGSAPLVTFDGVTKTYQNGQTQVHALDDVSLTIPKGEFVAVIGPSGSGKSTLLHLLAAMDRPTSGTVQVGDWNVGTLDRREQTLYRRSAIGIIFQQFHLVPTMTAAENVALPMILSGEAPGVRQKRALECLAMVDLADRADHRPSELSGGEQQRVATARALTVDPPLLLADEPTGNLDSETGAHVVDLLERVHAEQNRTVIVVTHHLQEIEHVAERIIRLKDGRVAEETVAA